MTNRNKNVYTEKTTDLFNKSVTSTILSYLIVIVLMITVVRFVLFPLLYGRLDTVCRQQESSNSNNTSLKYNPWLYVDNEPGGRYAGMVRLYDDVSQYATDRYNVECKRRQLWHIFLRTNLGHPLAVQFDRDTYVVSRLIKLTNNNIQGYRLRREAKCTDDWKDSQFVTIEHNTNDDISRLRRRLLTLAKRYTYRVSFDYNDETKQNRINVTFTDKKSGIEYKFSIDGYRPSVSYNSLPANTLPPVWLLARDSAKELQNSSTADSNRLATVNNLLSGKHTYESSPCYDKAIGEQRAGRKPVRSLAEFEELYLRGVGGRYPANERTKLEPLLKRFYFDCVYDTTVNTKYVDESLRSDLFPLNVYLRVCPGEQHFNPDRGTCV